jgi:hypothetical protein
MNKGWMTVMILFIAASVSAQVAEGGGTLPENSAPDPGIETAECGDGICQPVLKGSCPADCATENETDESKPITQVVLDRPEIISGGFTALSLSILLWVVLSRRRKKKDEKKELRESINRKLDERKEVEQIRRELRQEDYSEDTIEECIEEMIY